MITEAWQFQRKKALAPLATGPLSIASGWSVETLDHGKARAFIELFEWLGNVGSAKYCYGLLFGEHVAGAVCYTAPPSHTAFRTLLGREVGSKVLQLCRGASAPWAPSWVGSALISRSLKDLRRRFETEAVVAFADPRAGEVGVVYQASNAVYLGLTDSRGPGEYLILGRRYHARAVHKRFGSAAHSHLITIDPGYQRFQRTKKHRYLFILSRGGMRRRLLRQIEPLVRPFPRRNLV